MTKTMVGGIVKKEKFKFCTLSLTFLSPSFATVLVRQYSWRFFCCCLVSTSLHLNTKVETKTTKSDHQHVILDFHLLGNVRPLRNSLFGFERTCC